MATHALIAARIQGQFKTRFVYLDGDNVGNTLNQYYHTEQDLGKIFSDGDYSVFSVNEYFSERNGFTEWDDEFSSIEEMKAYMKEIKGETNKLKYMYFFAESTNEWYVISEETKYKWTSFSDLIRKGKMKDYSDFYPKKESFLKALNTMFPDYYDKKECYFIYYDSLIEENFWVTKREEEDFYIFARPFSPQREGDKMTMAINVVLK